MQKWQEHINAIDCANSPDKDNNLLSSSNIDRDACDQNQESSSDESDYALVPSNLAELAEINQMRQELLQNAVREDEDDLKSNGLQKSDVKNPFACYESICHESAASKVNPSCAGADEEDETEG